MVVESTPDGLDTLAQDKRVIRNRRKLQAISANAGQMLDLEEAHGSFQTYLRSHPTFEATVADLRKQFRFVGEHGAYYFLHVVGEKASPTTKPGALPATGNDRLPISLRRRLRAPAWSERGGRPEDAGPGDAENHALAAHPGYFTASSIA